MSDDVLATIQPGEMSQWSDIKKKDFCDVFEARAMASIYILLKTAEVFSSKAFNKKMVSHKHMEADLKDVRYFDPDGMIRYDSSSGYRRDHVGGRSVTELTKIAEERAALLLKELPPLKDAVQVIDPETAKAIDKREKLLARANKLLERFIELGKDIVLSEVEQDMTVAELREVISTRAKERTKTHRQMEDLGKEGTELDEQINKALYEGLPGLSDAIIKVCLDHVEKARMLSQMIRRVQEKVMFGDSDAAKEILEKFEQDEVKISDTVKAEFAGAMKKLRLAAKNKKRKS